MRSLKEILSNNDPLYGDTPRENAVPKILEQFKNKNSKKRFLRKTYGGEPDESELKDIEIMANTDLAMEEPSQYMLEYFQDFLTNARQSQTAKYLDQASPDPEREWLQAMDRQGKEFYQLGDYPTKSEQAQGVGGLVRVDHNTLKNYDMNTHYHPETTMSPEESMLPSGYDGDMGFARQLDEMSGKPHSNFVVDYAGGVSQYGNDNAVGIQGMLENYKNILASIKRKKKKSKLK